MQFQIVAMGGTFDIIHIGHLALLKKAFSISDNVIIGLTGDKFANNKGKKLLHNYKQRFNLLKKTIEKQFPNHSYTISKLDNDFGPAVIEGNVQALIVSEETSHQGKILNNLRKARNLPSVQIIVVPMVMATDGKRISTTRIRNSEIDSHGNLL